MARLTFARANAAKIASAPLYALGAFASLLVRRRTDTWVFASGAGYAEGPRELLDHVRTLASEHEPTPLRMLWLARTREELDEVRAAGVPAALRSSWQGFRGTLRAGVLVVSHGLGDVNRFGTTGAFVAQLWHGIPLKKVQLDSPVTFRSALVPASMLRAVYRRGTRRYRFVPAASDLSAQRLRSAFGVARDVVAVTGDPRDDVVVRGLRARDAVRAELESVLEINPGARLILYAPTWRDGEPDPGVPTADEWRAIDASMRSTGSVLVLRPHPHGVGDYGSAVGERIRMLSALATPDINRVLAAFDVLVTDYSSIAFDFALTGRPIGFLAPDVDHYAASRGLYEPYDEFSGGLAVSRWGDLLRQLEDPQSIERLRAHSVALAERHHRFTDGRNTERVFATIMTRLKGAR